MIQRSQLFLAAMNRLKYIQYIKLIFLESLQMYDWHHSGKVFELISKLFDKQFDHFLTSSQTNRVINIYLILLPDVLRPLYMGIGGFIFSGPSILPHSFHTLVIWFSLFNIKCFDCFCETKKTRSHYFH